LHRWVSFGEPRSLETVRVLVVDDNHAVRVRLCGMLAELTGVVVVAEAADAEGALHAVDLHAPDVVVLDIHLVGTSGLVILPRLKARPSPPHVIVVTSHPSEQHRRESLRQGADRFLDKAGPFADLAAALFSVSRRKPSAP
jgi:DNA-binding NarL/FixJ family response regulator